MNCEIQSKLIVEAIKKGHDPDYVVCPFYDVCKGTRCYLFDAEKMEESWETYNDLKEMEEVVKK